MPIGYFIVKHFEYFGAKIHDLFHFSKENHSFYLKPLYPPTSRPARPAPIAQPLIDVRPKGVWTYVQRLLARTAREFVVGNDATIWLKTDEKCVKIYFFFSGLRLQAERFQMSMCQMKWQFGDILQKVFVHCCVHRLARFRVCVNL